MLSFFLDVLPLFLAVILSELYEKLRRKKDWVAKKSTKKNLCEGHHLFNCTASLLCHFLLLSSSTLLPKWRTCWMTPMKIHNIYMGGILCDIDNENILQFNNSWLVSLKTWINYKETHIKLLVVFTKVLIKNKNLQTRCK